MHNIERHHALSVRHMAAVMKGRGEEMVLAAFKKAYGQEGLLRMAELKQFQPVIKAAVTSARDIMKQRFDGRHGVYVMSFFDLSRRKYENLNHASFDTYNADHDNYDRLTIWVNQHDTSDTVEAPAFAGRRIIEKERAAMYAGCEVLTSADGTSVERDVEVVAISLYSRYWMAMRTDISMSRKAQLCLFFDVTGGFRSTPFNHIEVGSADWASGRALSQLAIEPVAMNEYKEDYMYECLKNLTAPSLDRITLRGTLPISILSDDLEHPPIEKTIPVETRFCADQQGHKAAAGQTLGNHSPWCQDCVDPNVLPKVGRIFKAKSDIFKWYGEIGCKMKTEEGAYLRKHLSYQLLVGLPFKVFECVCGWSSGNEQKYRATLKWWAGLEEWEQKPLVKQHSQVDSRY